MASVDTRRRRPHNKSRFGCRACKLRRIKCDEVRPQCGNCVRLGKHCDFQPSVPSTNMKSHKLPIPRNHQSAQSFQSLGVTALLYPMCDFKLPFYPGQENSLRPLELRLFRHCIDAANKVLGSDDDRGSPMPNSQLITKYIPEIAVQSVYVMHAVLAMSARHLSFFNKSDRSLVIASHNYMGSAISKFQSVLKSKISAESVDAFYLTPFLIGVHLLSQHLLSESYDNKDGPVEWLHAFRGLRVVTKLPLKGLVASKVSSLLPPGEWPVPQTEDLDLSAISLGPFSFLMEDMDESTSVHEKLAYRDIVAYLSLLCQSRRRALVWWFLLDNQPVYLNLAARGDARALLLLGVYLTLVGKFNGSRPLGWTATRDVQSIKRNLDAASSLMLGRAIDVLNERFDL